MNAAERNEWLAVVAECAPDGRAAGLNALLSRLDAVCEGGIWEGAACSRAGAAVVAVRWFGAGTGYAAWRGKAAKVLRRKDAEALAPPDGFPWLTLTWDTARDALLSARLPARARGSVFAGEIQLKSEKNFSKMVGDAALSKVLDDFALHAPIRDLVFQFAPGASGKSAALPAWSLRLDQPLPWPSLLRLDLAGAFSASSSQSSFFVLDRRVTELVFEGETIWAYFR